MTSFVMKTNFSKCENKGKVLIAGCSSDFRGNLVPKVDEIVVNKEHCNSTRINNNIHSNKRVFVCLLSFILVVVFLIYYNFSKPAQFAYK